MLKMLSLESKGEGVEVREVYENEIYRDRELAKGTLEMQNLYAMLHADR